MSESPFRFCVRSLRRRAVGGFRGLAASCRRGAGPIVLLLILCSSGPVAAEAPPAVITRIEEDWSLQIGVPSPDENAPQITIVNSPSGNLNGAYAVFEINHIPVPEFFGGGLQLQSWSGDQNVGACHHSDFSSLSTPDEQIKFTTSLSLSDGTLQFEVRDGESATWGDFGGDGSLALSLATSLTDLSGYSPDKSAAFSRVSFAGNRVKKLVLTEVRYFSGADLVQTDSAQRVVHSYNVGE